MLASLYTITPIIRVYYLAIVLALGLSSCLFSEEQEKTPQKTSGTTATKTQTCKGSLPCFISADPPVQVSAVAGLVHTFIAKDPTEKPVTYSLVSGPEGATIGETSGAFTWQPQSGNNGDKITITIAATGPSGTATLPFTVKLQTHTVLLEGESGERQQLMAIAALPDGGYITAGQYYDGESGQRVLWRLGFNESGRKLWSSATAGSFPTSSRLLPLQDGGAAIIARNDKSLIGVARFDSKGKLLWHRPLSTSSDDSAFELTATEDEGFLLLKHERREREGTIANGTDQTHSWRSFSLVKLDKTGKQQWEKLLSDDEEQKEYFGANTLVLAPDGSFVLGRTTREAVGSEIANIDLLFVSADGNNIGEKRLLTKVSAAALQVSSAKNGGYHILLRTRGSDTQPQHLAIITSDPQGKLTSNQAIKRKDKLSPDGFLVLSDGGLAIFSETEEQPGYDDPIVLRTDSTGQQLWEKFFPHKGEDGENFALTAFEGAGPLAVGTSDGGFIVAGQISTNGDQNISLHHYGETGKEIFSKTFGGKAGEQPLAIAMAENGSFALLGQTYSFDQQDDANDKNAQIRPWVLFFDDKGGLIHDTDELGEK